MNQAPQFESDSSQPADGASLPSRDPLGAIADPVEKVSALPALHEPATESRWQVLSLKPSGLVAASDADAELRGPIKLREETPPPSFGHLFATLERLTAGLSVIGVTSTVRGEGKTTVALHLSRTAAESSYRRVCLLDLSLGEDELCRRVGAAPAPGGVVSFLESDGPLTVLQWPGPLHLSLFAAGKAPSNPARTARSPRIPELINALRDEYDLIVVDLPAVSTDNAAAIASHLDGSVFVVRAGATPRRIINKAMDTLGRENLVGVILNQVSASGRRSLGRGLPR